MFVYEKKLQYPVKIKNTNPALAKFIISQYGGPDGELGASIRYLSQRYAMPYPELKGLLTDIGTEELGHLEMIGTIVHQLTRSMTPEQIKKAGYDAYFVDHTAGIYPTAASGTPWSAAGIGVKGDVIADLTEDMAAEQKAPGSASRAGGCLGDDRLAARYGFAVFRNTRGALGHGELGAVGVDLGVVAGDKGGFHLAAAGNGHIVRLGNQRGHAATFVDGQGSAPRSGGEEDLIHCFGDSD